MDFTFLNNYFDKIFVITLPGAIERQENIKKVLCGLNFEFFFGADKKQFSVEKLVTENIYNDKMAKRMNRYNKGMTSAQVCCAWSHKMVYESIIHKGSEKNLILEDDIEPLAQLPEFQSKIFDDLPLNWDLLYLDYNKNEQSKKLKQTWYHIQRNLGGLRWGHKIIANLYSTRFSNYLSRAGYHDYADAYAVTRTGAKKLLKLQTPISFPADHLLSYACATTKIQAFISHPKLFHQLSQGINKRMRSLVDE